MQKRDFIILAALVALMIAWPIVDREFIKPRFFPQSGAVAREAEPQAEVPVVEEAPAAEEPPALVEAPPRPAEPQEEAEKPEELERPERPEETVELKNDKVQVRLSSWGASVVSATLKDYRETQEPDSGPVVMDFESMRALVYEALPGMGSSSAFDIEEQEGNRVVFARTAPSGVTLRRTCVLEDGYLLRVSDEFTNDGDESVALKDFSIRSGVMKTTGARAVRGVVFLGADTLSPGEKVQHLSRKMPKMFGNVQDAKGLPKLPQSIRTRPHEKPVDWVAVKNKYFVQILAPQDGGEYCELFAAREVLPKERDDPSFTPKMTGLTDVAAWIHFPGIVLQADETVTRELEYYVGPKKYAELAQMGFHRADVMEFGKLSPISKLLLRILNALHRWIWPHNYGLAIMLLTIIIRVVFWPVTHKSTESMKRMQEIQPLVNELRAKHKENPQKQQQAIMALYKEHKVNPMGGCLPMLVQIPVFIALFVVLRSAIELRFAPFLWIRDLSEPENLLSGMIPLVGSLNILPLVMSGTMFWQQKMTPGGGDSQQQKMMAFMPVLMLVFFYNFASGLVLYWTTNQCLMIAQQLIQKRRQAAKAAADD